MTDDLEHLYQTTYTAVVRFLYRKVWDAERAEDSGLGNPYITELELRERALASMNRKRIAEVARVTPQAEPAPSREAFFYRGALKTA